jgi:hypothetical protein
MSWGVLVRACGAEHKPPALPRAAVTQHDFLLSQTATAIRPLFVFLRRISAPRVLQH